MSHWPRRPRHGGAAHGEPRSPWASPCFSRSPRRRPRSSRTPRRPRRRRGPTRRRRCSAPAPAPVAPRADRPRAGRDARPDAARDRHAEPPRRRPPRRVRSRSRPAAAVRATAGAPPAVPVDPPAHRRPPARRPGPARRRARPARRGRRLARADRPAAPRGAAMRRLLPLLVVVAALALPATASAAPIDFSCTPAPASCDGWYPQPVTLTWTVSGTKAPGTCVDATVAVETAGSPHYCKVTAGPAIVEFTVVLKVDMTRPTVSGVATSRPARPQRLVPKAGPGHVLRRRRAVRPAGLQLDELQLGDRRGRQPRRTLPGHARAT